MALLSAVVMRVDLRPELDLLDDGLRLVLARFSGLERGLVLELAEVHQLADRRSRGRSDLNQVKVCFLGQPERIVDSDDPDLLAGRADEPHFGYADALVDTRFGADVTSWCHLSLLRAVPGQDLHDACRLHAEGPARRACRATMRALCADPACPDLDAPRGARSRHVVRRFRCAQPDQSARKLSGSPASRQAVRQRTRQRRAGQGGRRPRWSSACTPGTMSAGLVASSG